MTLSDTDIQVIAGASATVFAVLFGLWKNYTARKALIDMAFKAASFGLTEVSKRTDNKIDDKFAVWFKIVTETLAGAAKPVTVSEADARKVFAAMHKDSK